MDNKICQIHNEPALFCEKDAKQNVLLLCRFCLQKRFKLQNLDDMDNEQKQALQQLELKYDQSIKQLKDFAEKLEKYTLQIQQKLKKFKQQVEQNLTFLNGQKNEVKNKSNNFTILQLNQIKEEENRINNQFEQMKQQINNQLKELEISTKLEKLYQSINSFKIQVNNQVKEQAQTQKLIEFTKKFDYQQMPQLQYKQNQSCFAIAFNKQGNLMIAGCDNMIKVFEFKDDLLREVQYLNEHLYNTVTCLLFMKKSNQFISASNDKTIKIWEQNQNNQWQSIQILKGHTDRIVCITLNQNEDLLISVAYDRTIKFWVKQNTIWSCNQSIDCQSYVCSISLSNLEDKLIASVEEKQILIIQQQNNSWMINQIISVEQYGIRLCYINQDQFVFQPKDGQHLQIFDYDPKDQTFKKGQELQYTNKSSDGTLFFPIRFISQIGLLMVKHGEYLYLIKRSLNGKFTLEQSIYFSTQSLFGGITDDGRYIATWGNKSEEIQIRKFQY